MPAPRPVPAALLAACGLLAGCAGEPDPFAPPTLVPVTGAVTVDGEPMAGAVVTFLPVGEGGTMSIGETDDDGAFRLSYLGGDGAAPGSYKVGISYQITPAGKVAGLSARSALSMPEDLRDAVERVPPRYQDLGVTTLRAEVPPRGDRFRFELEGPLLDPPPPDAEQAGGPPGDADAPAPQGLDIP